MLERNVRKVYSITPCSSVRHLAGTPSLGTRQTVFDENMRHNNWVRINRATRKEWISYLVYMLQFKFLFGSNFSNQFDFYFPLSNDQSHNLRQRKIKIRLVLKDLNQK